LQIPTVYIPIIEYLRCLALDLEVRLDGSLGGRDDVLAREEKQNNHFFRHLGQSRGPQPLFDLIDSPLRRPSLIDDRLGAEFVRQGHADCLKRQ
jgi:hypothetical protein